MPVSPRDYDAAVQPDIYELYDSAKGFNMVGVAGVQTLQKSRELRDLVSRQAPGCRVLMQCSYHPGIGKWVPEGRAGSGAQCK